MENRFISTFGKYPHEYFLEDSIDSNFSTSIDFLMLDFVDIIGSIFFMDISIPRQTNRTRELKIDVPVSNVEIWTQNEVLIKKVIKFVSGDNLTLSFIEKNKRFVKDVLSFNLELDYNTVSLLSGGLDSFSGAFRNNIEKYKTIYVGYKLNYFEQSKQDIIKEFVLKTHRGSCGEFFNQIKIKKIESTQATRSLLFLVLACLVAYKNKIKNLFIYENGVLSLNPFKNGRFTTKTTHPKTITLFNDLLVNLGLNIQVLNPFLYNTKGEIINEISIEYKNQIKNTYTCSKSRQSNYLKNKRLQCGYCVPCLLRKISLAAYDNEKYDCEYEIDYKDKLSNKANLNQLTEYKSSVEYFRDCKKDIDNGTIFCYINVRENYYKEEDYFKKTNQMLKLFSLEVERYLDKYDIF